MTLAENPEVSGAGQSHPATLSAVSLRQGPRPFYFALWKVDSAEQWRPSSFCRAPAEAFVHDIVRSPRYTARSELFDLLIFLLLHNRPSCLGSVVHDRRELLDVRSGHGFLFLL